MASTCSDRPSLAWRSIRPQNIDAAIDYAVSHETEFHQFMLYTRDAAHAAAHGIVEEGHSAEQRRVVGGRLRTGSTGSITRHPHIPSGQETALFVGARFAGIMRPNGAQHLADRAHDRSAGWRRYKGHPSRGSAIVTAGICTATQRSWPGRYGRRGAGFADNAVVARKMDGLLEDVYSVCGWRARITAPVLGRVLLATLKREDKRLRGGWTSSRPPTTIRTIKRWSRSAAAERAAARLQSVGAGRLALTRQAMGVT